MSEELEEFHNADDAEGLQRDLAAAQRRIQKLERDKSTYARAAKDAEEARDETAKALKVYEAASRKASKPPKWTARKGRKKGDRGTVCVLMTDQHFDEIVRPGEVDDYNAYNREIAEKRLHKAFEHTVKLARDHVNGIEYDGVCCMFGGDVVTGYIHEELSENVDATLADTVVHWRPKLAAGIRMLADEFGKVFVPCVPGNHDRWNRKPKAKRRAKDSLTWIIYNLLASDFADDDRVDFLVTESADATFSLYDTTYLLTHGDQFRGGSGIAGALSPLMLGHYRKARRNDAMGNPFDVMVCGHFHQYLALPGLIVGNTLKGADEYSYLSNFVPSPPSQAFWITTPEHGPTFHAEVLVQDRAQEGW